MNEDKTYNDCEICSSLKDLEEGCKSWSEEKDLLPPNASKLINFHYYYPEIWLRICPVCGSYYSYTTWNELDSGWFEFVKLEKLNIKRVSYYFIRLALFSELRNLALSKKENAQAILEEIEYIFFDEYKMNKELITKNGKEFNILKNFCREILSS